MKIKRNSFFTFIFSFLPGAGHMYTGFMKKGLSFMSLFFGVFFISSFLNIDDINYILPVIWFYAFFDCINIRWSKEDDFINMEDDFLFSIDKLKELDLKILKKYNLYIGIACLIFGFLILSENLINVLSYIFPNIDSWLYKIYHLINKLPSLIISFLIILLGLRLIQSKKREEEAICSKTEELEL